MRQAVRARLLSLISFEATLQLCNKLCAHAQNKKKSDVVYCISRACGGEPRPSSFSDSKSAVSSRAEAIPHEHTRSSGEALQLFVQRHGLRAPLGLLEALCGGTVLAVLHALRDPLLELAYLALNLVRHIID